MAWKCDGYVYGLRRNDSDRYFTLGAPSIHLRTGSLRTLYAVKTGRTQMPLHQHGQKYGADNIVCDTLEVTTAANRFEAEKTMDRQTEG